ncbi:MAG TPA: tetratricopeptide repeat protein [Anaerolineae bacterium]|nr:tetratricopeptide repeat protein [Anaerolineae bacterium]
MSENDNFFTLWTDGSGALVRHPNAEPDRCAAAARLSRMALILFDSSSAGGVIGMDSLDSFGEWLRQRRRALDLTRDELAHCVGFSVSGLRKVEADERRPSRQMAELLAHCLQIPPEECPSFIKVARGVDRVERLGPPLAGLGAVSSRPVRTHVVSNLPCPPTPLIGREPELAALARLLCDPQCRLLTLVGPGGIGKTRLAIEAALSMQGQFVHGVFFVPLVSLAEPRFIIPAVADALGLQLAGTVDPHLQLLKHVRQSSLLLLLDNFEHLLGTGESLAQLLQHAPGVKLLVTSREQLNLQGEWLFDLQGLPVPPMEQVDWAEEYSAVELFVHHARRVQAGFELKAEEREAVSRICQLVGGMPLAIELAAAWVPVLSCAEIVLEIERSLDFLATSLRDVPERHHSLRAVFDHSWNLLSDGECKLLCRLAVFRGGFEREAAERVASASLPLLAALVSKSLVRRAAGGRYDLHEVVRQYALLHLDGDPQAKTERDQHSEYYLALLQERETALLSAAQREVIRELTTEIGNLRAAWAWAVKRERFVSLGLALRSFRLLHLLAGWLRTGIEQFDLFVQALRAQAGDQAERSLLGQALAHQGMLWFRMGEFGEAQICYAESLELLRPIGEPGLLADPLLNSGSIMHHSGEIDRARSVLSEGLSCAQAAGDAWYTAYGLHSLGYVASLLGRHEEGYEQMLAGLGMWRALGDPHYVALGLNFVSPTATQLGLHDEAGVFLHESLTLSTQLGDRWGMGTAYRNLGLVALSQGNIPEAQALLRKSLETFNGVVAGWAIAQALIFLGEATAAAGDLLDARRIFLDALCEATEAQTALLCMDALIGLAHVQAVTGETQQAVELSTYVLSHSASAQQTKDRAAQLLAQLEPQLAPQQVEAARDWAQAASLKTLVAELLDDSGAAKMPRLGCSYSGAR